MRIGLVRHFKVNCPHKKFMTAKEFKEWTEKYERSKVMVKPVEMNGITWDICYVSNMPRAITTAKEVYGGQLYIEKLLREVDTAPFIHADKIKLPFEVWHIFGRIAWLFKWESQPETRQATRKRVRQFLAKIDYDNENILIVSHAFMIFNIQRELRRMGFRGNRFARVKNGVLYELVGTPPKKLVERCRKRKNRTREKQS